MTKNMAKATNIILPVPQPPVETTERRAVGAVRFLRALPGEWVEFPLGEFRAKARIEGWETATFDGTAPIPETPQVKAVVIVGDNDVDRHGNNIGGGTFSAWGDTLEEALRAVAALPTSRRTRRRQLLVKTAIADFLRTQEVRDAH